MLNPSENPVVSLFKKSEFNIPVDKEIADQRKRDAAMLQRAEDAGWIIHNQSAGTPGAGMLGQIYQIGQNLYGQEKQLGANEDEAFNKLIASISAPNPQPQQDTRMMPKMNPLLGIGIALADAFAKQDGGQGVISPFLAGRQMAIQAEQQRQMQEWQMRQMQNQQNQQIAELQYNRAVGKRKEFKSDLQDFQERQDKKTALAEKQYEDDIRFLGRMSDDFNTTKDAGSLDRIAEAHNAVAGKMKWGLITPESIEERKNQIKIAADTAAARNARILQVTRQAEAIFPDKQKLAEVKTLLAQYDYNFLRPEQLKAMQLRNFYYPIEVAKRLNNTDVDNARADRALDEAIASRNEVRIEAAVKEKAITTRNKVGAMRGEQQWRLKEMAEMRKDDASLAFSEPPKTYTDVEKEYWKKRKAIYMSHWNYLNDPNEGLNQKIRDEEDLLVRLGGQMPGNTKAGNTKAATPQASGTYTTKSGAKVTFGNP